MLMESDTPKEDEMSDLNLPDEFTQLEMFLIDCDNIGENEYMMPFTQLKEILTALSEARIRLDAVGRAFVQLEVENAEAREEIEELKDTIEYQSRRHILDSEKIEQLERMKGSEG